MKTCGVLLGAIFKINPVIVEFTAFRDDDVLNKRTNIKAKKRKNNEILVEVELNLECGNIRKGLLDKR